MKNQIKNTVLAAAVSATITLALPYTADARELEYPSIPQRKQDNCGAIQEGNIFYYWRKKGLINGPDDPYAYVRSGCSLATSVFIPPSSDNVIIRTTSVGIEEGGDADQAFHRMAEWMKADDNAGLGLILRSTEGHGVAVESIREEKNRFVFKICSWGEKFELAFQRPVRWRIKEGYGDAIIGKVLSGNPKHVKYLYDGKGPNRCGSVNRVTLTLGGFYTIMSKKDLERDFKTVLECANQKKIIDTDKVHPLVAVFKYNPMGVILTTLPQDRRVYDRKIILKQYPQLVSYQKYFLKKEAEKEALKTIQGTGQKTKTQSTPQNNTSTKTQTTTKTPPKNIVITIPDKTQEQPEQIQEVYISGRKNIPKVNTHKTTIK